MIAKTRYPLFQVFILSFGLILKIPQANAVSCDYSNLFITVKAKDFQLFYDKTEKESKFITLNSCKAHKILILDSGESYVTNVMKKWHCSIQKDQKKQNIEAYLSAVDKSDLLSILDQELLGSCNVRLHPTQGGNKATISVVLSGKNKLVISDKDTTYTVEYYGIYNNFNVENISDLKSIIENNTPLERVIFGARGIAFRKDENWKFRSFKGYGEIYDLCSFDQFFSRAKNWPLPLYKRVIGNSINDEPSYWYFLLEGEERISDRLTSTLGC